MSTLYNGTKLTGDILLNKQLGTTLTLNTDKKYVDKDVEFTISVQSGIDAANTATADVNVQSGGTGNISGSIGSKTTTQPSSGYFIKLQAEGSGSSKITTAGWVDAGALTAASTTSTKYFPVASAAAGISGTNTVTPSTSITGSNVTLSNTNNGISVTSTGGGSASATVNASVSSAGFAAEGSLASGTINGSSQTTTVTSYISGVTLTAPSSGTRTFTVTVPNGNSTQTVTFKVDSSGNVTIE